MAKGTETYKVKDLKHIISEEVRKQSRIKMLNERKNQLQNELKTLLENNTNVLYQEPETQKSAGKSETIFHTKPGNVISLSFRDVQGIKLRRQKRETSGMINNDLMWRVEDPSNSVHLKRGDYLEVVGNDNLEKGSKFTFEIFRMNDKNELQPIGLKYETNELTGWLNNA